MSELWNLYVAFFRIGILTFGGGLTMLPMLKYELVEKRNWITEEVLLDCYAIGQCTPGIIAVNTATFVGYKRKGVLGGIVATLGMASPSILIITVVAMFLEAMMSYAIVQHAIMGIRGGVCALMLNTVYTLAKKSLTRKDQENKLHLDKICVAICAAAFLLAFFTPIPTVVIIVFAAVTGVVVDKMTGGAAA